MNQKPTPSTLRIAILASGRGSIMAKIQEAINRDKINAKIVMVIADKQDAKVMENAQKLSIPSKYIARNNKSRIEHEREITKILHQEKIDLLLLIGYMRILSSEFIKEWNNKILNVHPSLLPKFAGLMDLEVHEAVLQSADKTTGCTVHFIDESVDGGPILVQKKCFVAVGDTPEILKAKVQKLEAEAMILAIKKLIKNS